MNRKFAVVTGTRAEYGLLYWIIKGIHEDPDLELQLIVTGMHLAPEFGSTVRTIEADGFPIAERVEMLLSSDTKVGMAISMGLGIIGFSQSYSRLEPDLIVVLGDRFEIFSAVAAAVPFEIPVAHIHGGETTEGAIDELFRHAMTKMSHIHFPATRLYANRIIQMGEDASRVFCCGAPGIDNVFRLKLMTREEIVSELSLPADRPIGVVTYHPVTLQGDSQREFEEILAALLECSDVFWAFTASNADAGGRGINHRIDEFLKGHEGIGKKCTSLGQLRYLSLLKHASVMVGNSSSGIIEAPSLQLPVVNIGDRQKGRVMAGNVVTISPPVTSVEVLDAIKRCLTRKCKSALNRLPNPYGNGNTSEQILSLLKRIDLSDHRKRFFEIGFSKGAN